MISLINSICKKDAPILKQISQTDKYQQFVILYRKVDK